MPCQNNGRQHEQKLYSEVGFGSLNNSRNIAADFWNKDSVPVALQCQISQPCKWPLKRTVNNA